MKLIEAWYCEKCGYMSSSAIDFTATSCDFGNNHFANNHIKIFDAYDKTNLIRVDDVKEIFKELDGHCTLSRGKTIRLRDSHIYKKLKYKWMKKLEGGKV